MKLDNMRLRTKSLIPLAAMTVAVFCISGFAAYRLHAVSSSAYEIISVKDKGAMYVARASREAMMAPYSAFGALIFEGDSPEGRTAQSDFQVELDHLKTSLDIGAQTAPDYASTFDDMRNSLKDMQEQGKAPMAAAQDSPGLAAGRALAPETLDKLAEGAKAVTEMDSKARDIATGLLNINDEMISDSVKSGRELMGRSKLDLIMLAAAALATAVAAGAMMAWVSQTKIARPLTRLAQRAQRLAEGDLEADIDGAERKDEIGDIARAILELREHARERRRLEAQAEAARRAADAERERAQADRARAQTELSQAVSLLGRGLHAVASGDLTLRLRDGFPQEYGALRQDFNGASERLEDAIGEVAECAQEIRGGAQGMTGVAAKLSARTERQAASLEEAAAALEQISSAMSRSVANATEASAVVSQADGEARQGAQVVRNAIAAINAIANSAEQINQIVGVIDELALQTNLLALNAGVEAARAGEAGRGFAVVASEVRALALRSADSAKQIRTLVRESAAQIDSGVRLADESGQALERIVAQVSRINGLVSDMTASVREQATGIEGVNAAVGEMDKSTQENAAMVEETAESARVLAAESERLAELVAQFRVGVAAQEAPRQAA